MDGHRVTHPAVPKNLLAALAAFAPVADDVEGEDRAELLDRQGVVASDPRQGRQQDARLGRHRQAALRGDDRRGFPDERRVGQPLRRHEHPAHGVDLGGRHEVAALGLELPFHLFGNRLVDDDRVFGRAEHAVVERLARDDVADGLADVRRALDVRRGVAWPDAVGGLACAVGRADQAHAARREDHGDVPMLHQLLRALEGHGRHPRHGALGCAGPSGRLLEHLGDASDAPHRRWMRAQHDRAPGLERDEDLVDRRRGGVGRRDDRGDDTKGLRNLDHPADLVAGDDTHGLHRADELVDLVGGEQILLNLVGDDAVPGFLDGKRRERFGLRAGGGGDGVHDRIDLRLRELSERSGGHLRATGQRARLGDGREVAVGLGRGGVRHVRRSAYRRVSSRPWGGCARPRRAGGG